MIVGQTSIPNEDGLAPMAPSTKPEVWLTTVRWLGLILFFGHLPFAIQNLWAGLDGSVAVLSCLAGATLGYVLADLASGLVHWASDSYGRRNDPILGPLFVRPFRDHHLDEKAITRESFLELHGANCFFAAPLLLIATHFFTVEPGAYGQIFLTSVLVMNALGVLAAGAIHRWVHQDKTPSVVAHLQRLGLVISVSDHAIHHGGTHTSHYCIVSGWCNEPLKRWDVLARCERRIESVFGLRVTRDHD